MTEEQFTDDQGNIITKKVSDQGHGVGRGTPQPFSSPSAWLPCSSLQPGGPCKALVSCCLRLQSRHFSGQAPRMGQRLHTVCSAGRGGRHGAWGLAVMPSSARLHRSSGRWCVSWALVTRMTGRSRRS